MVDQAKKVRGLSGSSMCYFTQVQFPETTGYVDLRPWMDSTPITLSHVSSMQVAVQLFEKLVFSLSSRLNVGGAIRVVDIKGISNGSNHEEGRHSKHGIFDG
jgi:hypothetical protein